jgi:hypothetical protein
LIPSAGRSRLDERAVRDNREDALAFLEHDRRPVGERTGWLASELTRGVDHLPKLQGLRRIGGLVLSSFVDDESSRFSTLFGGSSFVLGASSRCSIL